MYLIYLIFFASVLYSSCTSNVTTGERPNIILFIADDMNWNDCGAYGNPAINTPHIDNLAKEGMIFTNAFLTTSSCSPSRISIFTGKYPHNTDAEQLHWPLPEGHTTFVELLKSNEYWTGLAGKYHLGDAVRSHFDLIMEVGTAGFQLGTDGKQQKEAGDGSGCESWIDLLNSVPGDQPFFLLLAAVDPHRPYDQGIIDNPHDPENVRVPPYLPDVDEVRTDLALYYDEISRMDQYIGKVLAELGKKNIEDNTFILFISDNGRPFPRDKTTLYEGGIKTPWIVRWPEKIKAGSINANLVSSVDIAPTVLSMAGINQPSVFEGVDFTSMVLDPNASIRDEIYAEDHWHDFEDYTRAIRTKKFKYIRNFYPDLPNTPPADAFRSISFQAMLRMNNNQELNEAQSRCFEVPRSEEELYDIISDPNELINLAANSKYQNKLVQMRELLNEYRTITDDYIPKERTPDDFDRQTGFPTEHRVRPRPSKAEMMK
jgi:arylsulfatase A-like enzyme